NRTNEPLPSVSVMLKDNLSGTYTDQKGKFILRVSSWPVTLIISSVGFSSKEVTTDVKDLLEIGLEPAYSMGKVVVIAATRAPLRILESIVSIERINNRSIEAEPTTSNYDLAGYLKSINLNTSSITYITISNRVFTCIL